MIVIKCIKQVETELNTINSELERIKNNKLNNTDYKAELLIEKQKLEEILDKYKLNLYELPDIESRLYRKLVYEGKNVTKAVDEIAEENYLNSEKTTHNFSHFLQLIHFSSFIFGYKKPSSSSTIEIACTGHTYIHPPHPLQSFFFPYFKRNALGENSPIAATTTGHEILRRRFCTNV